MPESLQAVINKLMEELIRSMHVLGTTLTAVETQIKQQNRRQYEILAELKNIQSILTDDEHGLRTRISQLIKMIEDNTTENLESKKSLWSLRNGIIILLSNAIVGAIVYLITH